MKKYISILALALALASCGSGSDYDKINVIPKPVEVKANCGKFTLDKETVLVAQTPDELATAAYFNAKIQNSCGFSLATSNVAEGKSVSFRIDPALGLEAEGYTLSVKKGAVEVTGVDADGLFFGMQTLLQLFPASVEAAGEQVSLKAQCVEIKDYPKFHYRGMHLDPCRHWEPVEFVKKQLDVMAMYKFNKMHWHITEDQGWRIEIKSYPKLTQFGPYYTQEEVKDIVAYAAERHIEVIPEFDLPGHCGVAIAAYPWLSCYNFKIAPREIWGIDEIVLCPGKESTFRFLDEVLSEMAQLFPCKYFHVGGDECPKTHWKTCPDCQKRIAQLGLKSDDKYTAEDYLQTYVLDRVQAVLGSFGKTVIGWDELLAGDPAKDAVIMSWRGNQGGIEGTARGHRCIMTASKQGMYLDYAQGDLKAEPVASSHYNPLSHTYAYNPIPEEVAAAGNEKLILGCQCNTWSEYMYTNPLAEYYIYPRAIAVAEIGWCENEAKDYDYFVKRLEADAHLRLDAHNINYHVPMAEQPLGSREVEAFTESIDVEFKTTRPEKMVYTLDGTEPTPSSKVYTKPLHFTEDAVIKIAVVLPNNNRLSTVRTVFVKKVNMLPAADLDTLALASGLKVSSAEPVAPKSVARFDDLRKFYPINRYAPSFKEYLAEGEGYFLVPADGTYYFSTELNRLWIDGEQIISNDGECKRNSRHDASLVLAAGLHAIKGEFSSDMIGGYPSCRGNMDVRMRPAAEEEFHSIKKYWF